MTPLDKTLKRSLMIKREEYVVTLSPESIKLTRKGRRIGTELRWEELVSGDKALAVALQASIGKFDERQKPSGTRGDPDSKSRKPTDANSRDIKQSKARSRKQ